MTFTKEQQIRLAAGAARDQAWQSACNMKDDIERIYDEGPWGESDFLLLRSLLALIMGEIEYRKLKRDEFP